MKANKQKVLQWIDDNQDQIVAFLRDLIKIPSVNPWFEEGEAGDKSVCHEGDAQRYIRAHMESLGAEIDMWEPDVEHLRKYEGQPNFYDFHVFTDRPNLAARLKGTGGGKSVLLMGHIDTVKVGSGWNHGPFSADLEDGVIYGRGAVDMKGGIASMIMAAEAILKSGLKLKGDICVGTVVDEETGGMGTLDFVDRGHRADVCIMTEATRQIIAPLCRGILWGNIIVEGRSGHIELPQKDWRDGGTVDAIRKARLIMDAIDHLNEDWAKSKVHPLLKIPNQIIIGQINAGEWHSTFANKADMAFDIQYLPYERDEVGGGSLVMKEFEDFIHAVAQTDPWLKEHPPKVTWTVNCDCGETPVDHEIVQLFLKNQVEQGLPAVAEGCYFHTDMGWQEKVGIPVVNYGPGDPICAHQDNESVSVADLIQCTKVMELTIMDWCGFDE